jgi:hypothetical protein
MAESLQKIGNRRSLASDIAHKYAVLAVQRANLEALQDGIYPYPENLVPILSRTIC